jgi:hypothetical protein
VCRIPKVVVVAPEQAHADLRRTLSSLDYEIVATVSSVEEIGDISADVVVLYEPDAAHIAAARERSLKTVSIGGADGADLELDVDHVTDFKTRVWELFRPS